MIRFSPFGLLAAIFLLHCARHASHDSAGPEVPELPAIITSEESRFVGEFRKKIEGTWEATQCRYLAPAGASNLGRTTYTNDRLEFGNDGLFSVDTRVYGDDRCQNILNRLQTIGRFTLTVSSAQTGIFSVRVTFRHQFQTHGGVPPTSVFGSSKYRQLFLSSTKSWAEGVPLRILNDKLYTSYHTTKFTHHYRRVVAETAQ